MYEIRIHNRGGQGGKSAAEILAATALAMGKEAQAFPEYGPERYGAPIKSYVRISDEIIRTVQPVVSPDLVLVLDATLLENKDITEGLRPDSNLIVNSPLPAKEIEKKTGKVCKIHIIDASSISQKRIGKNFPNIPMAGAAAKISGQIDLNALLKEIENKFGKKMNPDLIKANLEAAKEGYEIL